MSRRKIKRNLRNLLISVPGSDSDNLSYGFKDDVQTFLDAYGDIVLGDGQDPYSYQEYKQLDLEDKWNFIKEYEDKSEKELTNDFWKWKYGESTDDSWHEDNMDEEYYNLMELEDEGHDEFEQFLRSKLADKDNTPVTVTAEDKDADGDVDKIEAEKDKPEDDNTDDKPHDEELKPKSKGLAGDTTLEEELMLNPNMSPKEFNELAGKKRGAKKGEPAPDMDLNVLSDNTQKNIISALAERKW